MSMIDKIQQLQSMCKNSISIEINRHRDYYEPLKQHIDNHISLANSTIEEEIDIDIYNKMIETDTCIEVQAYPHTANGFYKIWHYDLESAIDLIIAAIAKEDT